MKRVALAIEKGGTGKTTSAVHLAHGLALMGRNVLLVDTDTQDQCAAHLGVRQYQRGLAEIILGLATPRQAVQRVRERLYLLPAGEALDQVKAGLDDIAARTGTDKGRILETALSFTASGKLDWIVMDTAPGSDAFLLNVLLLADIVITPVPPEMLAIRGMMRFFRTLRLLGRRTDFILPTIHDRRVTKTGRIMAKLEERYGGILLPKISYSSLISEAAGAGLTLHEYKPGHAASLEYLRLAETIDKEAGAWRTNAA